MSQESLWAPRIYTPNGFVKENILNDKRALDIGCGNRKLPGAVGMDVLSLPAVDVVHDINQTPWPFEKHSFDLVFMNHALEHVDDVVKTLEETHRILKPGGRVVIQVPYFRALDSVVDPTHRHFFASQTLDYFVEGTGLAKYAYSNATFKKRGFWYGWPHASTNPIRQIFKQFIHSSPLVYDQYLSLLMPTECLTWELEAL
ncbi:MAG: class I SAM-dependent methyltransferase [Patescibacteria group bacterium]